MLGLLYVVTKHPSSLAPCCHTDRQSASASISKRTRYSDRPVLGTVHYCHHRTSTATTGLHQSATPQSMFSTRTTYDTPETHRRHPRDRPPPRPTDGQPSTLCQCYTTRPWRYEWPRRPQRPAFGAIVPGLGNAQTARRCGLGVEGGA